MNIFTFQIDFLMMSIHNTPISSPIQLLIAEDHILYRNALRQSLSRYPDIECRAMAGNGRELLELLARVPVDAVLLDINMPVMDGIQVLPVIRTTYPHIKVIILSMQNNEGMIEQLLRAGAHAYALKTAEASVIFETVRACMQETPRSGIAENR